MSDQTTSLAKQLVPYAQVVGITGSGLLSGLIAACSYVAIGIIESTAPDDLIAKQWKKTYDIGVATAPPCAIACSVCFGFLASQSTKLTGRFPNWPFDPTTPLALYMTAAVLIPSIAPYTMAIMLPTNKRLMQKAEKFDAVSPSETKQLLQKWKAMNYNRAISVAVGSLLGAIATVMS